MWPSQDSNEMHLIPKLLLQPFSLVHGDLSLPLRPCSSYCRHTQWLFSFLKPARAWVNWGSQPPLQALAVRLPLGSAGQKAQAQYQLVNFLKKRTEKGGHKQRKEAGGSQEHSKPVAHLTVINNSSGVSPSPTRHWPGILQLLTEKVPSSWATAQSGRKFTVLESESPRLESQVYHCQFFSFGQVSQLPKAKGR